MVLCSQFVRDDISDTFLHSPHHHLSWKRCIMWVVLQGNAGKKELKASAAHLLLSCFHSILCTRGSNMSYFYWANVVMLNAAFIMVLMMLCCCHAGLILDGESNAATCHNKWREVVNTKYDLLFGENYSSSCWYSVVKNYHKKIFFHISREEKNAVVCVLQQQHKVQFLEFQRGHFWAHFESTLKPFVPRKGGLSNYWYHNNAKKLSF